MADESDDDDWTLDELVQSDAPVPGVRAGSRSRLRRRITRPPCATWVSATIGQVSLSPRSSIGCRVLLCDQLVASMKSRIMGVLVQGFFFDGSVEELGILDRDEIEPIAALLSPPPVCQEKSPLCWSSGRWSTRDQLFFEWHSPESPYFSRRDVEVHYSTTGRALYLDGAQKRSLAKLLRRCKELIDGRF